MKPVIVDTEINLATFTAHDGTELSSFINASMLA